MSTCAPTSITGDPAFPFSGDGHGDKEIMSLHGTGWEDRISSMKVRARAGRRRTNAQAVRKKQEEPAEQVRQAGPAEQGIPEGPIRPGIRRN